MVVIFGISSLIISVLVMLITLILSLSFLEVDSDKIGRIFEISVGSILLGWIGAWLWQYFSSPVSIVDLTWFVLVLIIALLIVIIVIMVSTVKLEQSLGPFLAFILFIMLNKTFLILGVALIIGYTKSKSEHVRFKKGLIVLTTVFGLIIVLTGASLFLYTPVDNARYFDDQLIYDDGLPFTQRVRGQELRVVDFDLAQSIMRKRNTIGSNTIITDIHLGKINGSTYWIGAISFSGNKFFRQDMNMYQAFIAVDFRDPQLDPIIIKQEFHAGPELVLSKQLSRIVADYDRNYIIGENNYFTFNDDEQDMRLIVPYSIHSGVYFDSPGAGVVTQEIQKQGGLLEINADGRVINDYKNSEDVPDYASVQFYSETWLEREINYWGRSISGYHEFKTLARFGGIFAEELRMGIDDDTRVIIDPNTGEDIQLVMLDSTGSETEILRGAIKANRSGMYFYDWSQYGFIDTNAAHKHGESALTEHFGNTLHGYTTLLPVLYPIVDNPQSMYDFAYVMPLLFRDVRFGGIVITDPADQTGAHSIVKIADEDGFNITRLVDLAVEEYLLAADTTEGSSGKFVIDTISSYTSSGDTVFVMQGNLTINSLKYETIIFKQEFITVLQEWLLVVNAKVGDTLVLELKMDQGVLHATSVSLP